MTQEKKLIPPIEIFEDCLMTVLVGSDGLTLSQIKAVFLLALKSYFVDKANLGIISLAGIELYQNFHFKIVTQGGELDRLLCDAVEIDDKLSVDPRERKRRLAIFLEYFQKNLGVYGPLDLRVWEKYTKNKKIKKIKDAKMMFSKVLQDFENQKITRAELSYLLEKIGISEGGKKCFYQEDEIYKYFHRIPTINEIIVLLIFDPQKLEERFNTQLSKILEFEKKLKP